MMVEELRKRKNKKKKVTDFNIKQHSSKKEERKS